MAPNFKCFEREEVWPFELLNSLLENDFILDMVFQDPPHQQSVGLIHYLIHNPTILNSEYFTYVLTHVLVILTRSLESINNMHIFLLDFRIMIQLLIIFFEQLGQEFWKCKLPGCIFQSFFLEDVPSFYLCDFFFFPWNLCWCYRSNNILFICIWFYGLKRLDQFNILLIVSSFI